MRNQHLFRILGGTLLVIGIVVILYFARTLLLPLIFAALLAMLFHPIDQKIRDAGGPAWLGITVSTLALIIVFSAILALVGWQTTRIADDSEQIEQQFTQFKSEARNYLTETVGLSSERIDRGIENAVKQTGTFFQSFVGTFTATLGQMFLGLIYFILFLLQKDRFKEYFYRIYYQDTNKAEMLLEETNHITRRYLVGKLVVMAILAGTYILGFWLVGIQYFVFLGLIAALLSIIPYIGNFIGGGLAVVVTILSGGLTDALLVVGVMVAAQIVESYVLTPLIIGDEVGLNPWATVVGVVGFGLLWGIGGTIIALPVLGIVNEFLKDHQPTSALGFVLGQDKFELRTKD